jgi:molybdopterin synthase catalytic subunit
MSVRVTISDGPLEPRLADDAVAGAGALVRFEGVVRSDEGGRALLALDYEVYEPMASLQLTRIAREIVGKHALLRLDVRHSRGRVAVGQVSLRALIASAHRHEALAAMTEFLDRLKRDVPIWKTPIFRDGLSATG